jgi:hypothetical protein
MRVELSAESLLLQRFYLGTSLAKAVGDVAGCAAAQQQVVPLIAGHRRIKGSGKLLLISDASWVRMHLGP